MVTRFHGVDRHRRVSTVSVLNRESVEEKFVSLIFYTLKNDVFIL